jgi:endonuclease/exonuclease/phosphatase family metal-dependent hydrolase
MKTFKLFLGIIALSMTISGYTQTLTVASYNIRYSIEENHKSDSIKGEDWKRRGPAVAQLIKFHEFEMFGIQEGLLHQLTDLLEWLPGYQYVGVGRDDGEEAGEHTAVFYQAEKFKVLDHGDFWLSETPEKPSMGWDGTCCHRMCTWVYFEHIKSGEKFYFFNTHFDHQAVIARKESSKLILKKIKEIADDQPVIFMGDLNGDHDSDWYKTLKNSEILRDTYLMADNPYAQNGSFNGFGSRNETNRIIDHVFVSKHFSVDQWGILTDTYHGKFPSDHFPIMVKIRMK